MNPTWKAALGVILIFILGWFGGALTTLIIARHKMLGLAQRDPEPIARMLERQTTRNLGLDADKEKQLHALFVENIRARMEMQRTIQPQIRAINGGTLQQIDALLTTDQQQRFHENLVRFKQRFGRNPFIVAEENSAPAARPAAIGSGPVTPPAPVQTN